MWKKLLSSARKKKKKEKKEKVELWATPLALRRPTGKCHGSWDLAAGRYICIPTHFPNLLLTPWTAALPDTVRTSPADATWALQWPCTGASTRRTASSRPTAPGTTPPMGACGSGRSSPAGAGARGGRAFTCWERDCPSSAGCPGTGWRSGSWETPWRGWQSGSCTFLKVSRHGNATSPRTDGACCYCFFAPREFSWLKWHKLGFVTIQSILKE